MGRPSSTWSVVRAPDHAGVQELVVNEVPNKVVKLKTTASVELAKTFSARVISGDGTISVASDLTGLRESKP